MCAELYGVGAAEPGQPEEQVRGNIRAPGSLKRKHVTPEYLDGYDAGTKCKGRDQNDLFKILIEPPQGRQNCGLHEQRASQSLSCRSSLSCRRRQIGRASCRERVCKSV